MRINSVDIENMLGHNSIFDTSSYTIISGTNGAGKTNILSAICLGIYGTSPFRRTTIGKSISKGFEEGRITVIWEHNNETYKSERILKDSSHTAKLYKYENETFVPLHKGSKISVYDRVLLSIIPSYDVFLNVCLPSLDHPMLLSKPAQKRRFVSSIYGLDDIFPPFEEYCNTIINDLRKEIKKTEAVIAKYINSEEELLEEQESLNQLEEKMNSVKERLEYSKETYKEWKERIAEYDEILEKQRKLKGLEDVNPKELSNLIEEKRNEANKLYSKYTMKSRENAKKRKLNEKIEQKNTKLSLKLRELEALTGEGRDELYSDITVKINSEKCKDCKILKSMCGQIDAERITQLIRDTNGKELEELYQIEPIRVMRKAIDKLREEADNLSEKLNKVREAESIGNKIVTREQYENAESKLRTYKLEVNDLTEQHERLLNELRNAEREVGGLLKSIEVKKDAEELLNTINSDTKDWQNIKSISTEAYNNIINAHIKGIEENITEVISSVYEDWIISFQDTEISITKPTSNDVQQHTYDEMSLSQKKLISLGVSSSLSSFTGLNLLILDEFLDNFRPENKELLIPFLRELSKEHQIIATSLDADLIKEATDLINL